MKILYQIAIIFLICLIGDLISILLPFYLPPAIIALLLLYLLLEFKILKIDHIREKGDFLLTNMAFFFIPAGVGVIEYFSVIKTIWWQFLTIVLLSTILVFFVTGISVTFAIKIQERLKKC